MKISRLLIVGLLALLPLAACHELGHIDDSGGLGSTTGELVGEVQYVDTSAREIELRTDAGRTWTVGYDNQTRVVYRQRNHTVDNLEAGDFVALRTRQDRSGRLFTDTITVRESVQDRGYAGTINNLRGTVIRNDPRYSSILVETADRRQQAFYHDGKTRIRYRNRDYPVQSIEAGDQINVRTRTAANQQTPTADFITVTSKANDPATTPGSARLERFEGTVEFIDTRRGQFEVRDRNNRLVVVNLLYNPAKTVSDRFNRLRNGDSVRIEGRFINQDRFELENFL